MPPSSATGHYPYPNSGGYIGALGSRRFYRGARVTPSCTDGLLTLLPPFTGYLGYILHLYTDVIAIHHKSECCDDQGELIKVGAQPAPLSRSLLSQRSIPPLNHPLTPGRGAGPWRFPHRPSICHFPNAVWCAAAGRVVACPRATGGTRHATFTFSPHPLLFAIDAGRAKDDVEVVGRRIRNKATKTQVETTPQTLSHPSTLSACCAPPLTCESCSLSLRFPRSRALFMPTAGTRSPCCRFCWMPASFRAASGTPWRARKPRWKSQRCAHCLLPFHRRLCLPFFVSPSP